MADRFATGTAGGTNNPTLGHHPTTTETEELGDGDYGGGSQK